MSPHCRVRMEKAIEGGQIGVLNRFLNKVTNPIEILPHDTLAIAALYGHKDPVEFLLPKGMSIDNEGIFASPLRVASLMNRKQIVQLLLERGADINASGSMGDAMHIAALKGHTSMVRLLIDEGVDVNVLFSDRPHLQSFDQTQVPERQPRIAILTSRVSRYILPNHLLLVSFILPHHFGQHIPFPSPDRQSQAGRWPCAARVSRLSFIFLGTSLSFA
jgi:ankyrin repeat protein